MHHLPIEITRMIYVFLGYFPCQGRLIPVKEVQSFLDKLQTILKTNSSKWAKITIPIAEAKGSSYFIDRENDLIIIRTQSFISEEEVWILKKEGYWSFSHGRYRYK
jgi:hypothetical protein